MKSKKKAGQKKNGLYTLTFAAVEENCQQRIFVIFAIVFSSFSTPCSYPPWRQ
jgi:hypothetical protein